MTELVIEHADWNDYLPTIAAGSADLVLTDPPFAIARETGFTNTKLAKYAVYNYEFGDWDKAEIDAVKFAAEIHRLLRAGGTAIVWYDLWKITTLKDAMEAAGFKMLRLIVWQKTNPVPVNSKRFYLSNSREIAVCGVKGGKPTFHSEFDPGVYSYPSVPGGKNRLHPTQKPVKMFEEIIAKHSDPDDLVVDAFCGSGTTAVAAGNTGRRFKGCELDENYARIANERLQAASMENVKDSALFKKV